MCIVTGLNSCIKIKYIILKQKIRTLSLLLLCSIAVAVIIASACRQLSLAFYLSQFL